MRQVGPLLKLYEVGRAAKHKKIMDWGYLKSRQKQVTLHMQDKWKFGHVTNTRCLSLLNRHWTPNKVQNNTKRKSNWTPVQYAVCASKLHAASINHYNKKKIAQHLSEVRNFVWKPKTSFHLDQHLWMFYWLSVRNIDMSTTTCITNTNSRRQQVC